MNMLEVQDNSLIEHSRHSEKNEASQNQSIHHFSGRYLGSRSNTLWISVNTHRIQTVASQENLPRLSQLSTPALSATLG
jgi:hypothetical protein